MNRWKSRAAQIVLIVCLLGLTSCGLGAPTAIRPVDGLTNEQVATLGSLRQVDGYPLYVMYVHGAYERVVAPPREAPVARIPTPAWGCSLFAALGDPDGMFFGRNFDWQYSPALLLFTDPPDAYASVSMVDIAYLIDADQVGTLVDLPLKERMPLLDATHWPFDGMNEQGLAVGMAAVPESPRPVDPARTSIDSLSIIREMLDRAGNVDEALAILDQYNVEWEGGPPLHYLIADATGRAVLVEFYKGERVALPNATFWHLATNFLRSEANEAGRYRCPRYDRILTRMEETSGQLTLSQAMDLLADVAQEGTQWSVVYGISSGEVRVSMDRHYRNVHAFRLDGERK